jgi:hypothetical protein
MEKKMYLVFVDFEKAFDSIHRESFWKILRYYGIPEKLVSLLIALYENTEFCVRTNEGSTRYFHIKSGVKQGCVLSPLLFVLVIDYVLRDCTGFSIQLRDNKLLADLDFVDDIILMETKKKKLQDLLDVIREKASLIGLKVNSGKTKSMATSDSPLDIRCGDTAVEQVVEFKYLGNTVERTGSSEKEVQSRIGQASGAFNRLKPVWRSKKYSTKLKLRLFNSNVLSTLLYNSENWKLNQQQEKRILAFENNCLRRILNIDWRAHVTNQSVRSMSCQPLVTDVIRQRRWRYLGHVIRMTEDRLPKTVLEWQPQGSHRRGRPKNTLRRTYQRDLKHINTTVQPQWEDIWAAAHMRDDWRLFLDALGASGGTGGTKV